MALWQIELPPSPTPPPLPQHLGAGADPLGVTPEGQAHGHWGSEADFVGSEAARALLRRVNATAPRKVAERTEMNICGAASAQLDASRRGILAFHLQVLNGKYKEVDVVYSVCNCLS